tara:strand:- start:2879 stop:3790 length:912 start_codon:yes stop_codon:yes gene_type:complete
MEKYTGMINDEKFCRICLEEENNINSLISPCRCSGSSKHVHIQCLQNWRRVSRNSNGIGENECMECKTKYLIRKNHDREKIIKFHIGKLIQMLYYTPLVISIIIYMNDSNYNFITFLDGGKTYPIKTCSTYLSKYYNKNQTVCIPINVKGYLVLNDDGGLGYMFYLSIILAIHSALLITSFSMYQLKILKNPVIFFKNFNIFYLFSHIIISLKMFIFYYSLRFTYPFTCLMLSCISIPLETINITKVKERYTRILTDMNDEIAEDDSILSWSENYVEGEGYDMVEIQEDNYSSNDDEYDDSDL